MRVLTPDSQFILLIILVRRLLVSDGGGLGGGGGVFASDPIKLLDITQAPFMVAVGRCDGVIVSRSLLLASEHCVCANEAELAPEEGKQNFIVACSNSMKSYGDKRKGMNSPQSFLFF